METILVSAGVVAFAEIGDKTQLLAILLAARFQAPLPVILGILAATLFNHTLAAVLGIYIGGWLGENLSGILAVSFIGMGLWTLLPDKLDSEPRLFDKFGAFGATLIAFFLIEMGDKTQLATMALAARFNNVVLVTTGTTLGMMIADVPAVYAGNVLANKIPLKLVRLVAAAIFLVLGLAAALDWGRRFVFA
ncbi:MAG TPA: TMEM165/GDT1 family protein [Micropepsaceae bacterium]|jgi:putative Ca2+/H+ antiporter (TMEM165/GDT1 family)|nr:TMEM165/GDT1 family protein [Micropepsaceae bacterium]